MGDGRVQEVKEGKEEGMEKLYIVQDRDLG